MEMTEVDAIQFSVFCNKKLFWVEYVIFTNTGECIYYTILGDLNDVKYTSMYEVLPQMKIIDCYVHTVSGYQGTFAEILLLLHLPTEKQNENSSNLSSVYVINL